MRRRRTKSREEREARRRDRQIRGEKRIAECSIEHKWLSIQQNAVEGFYSLEYIEAIFSFTEEIIDKVKSLLTDD